MPRETGCTLVTQNKRARHNYQIGKTYKAGLVFTGTEVKTLRTRRAFLAEAFATVDDGKVWLRNVNIPEYKLRTWRNHAVKRSRKLPLNRKEIARLARETETADRTIVPPPTYFKDGCAKVGITATAGKRDWGKRRGIAERDANHETQWASQTHNRLGSGRR